MNGSITHSEKIRIETSKQFELGHGCFVVAKFLDLSLSTSRNERCTNTAMHVMNLTRVWITGFIEKAKGPDHLSSPLPAKPKY